MWLVKAGRGWGKTRVGAEWVRSVAQPGARIALVGPTAADVRDVMIEGESGILSVCEPWNLPTYEPSKRRLTWPNGAMATAYSAEEPDRLRGPQHTHAWCLAGDTLVSMADGTGKRLEDVRAGEFVLTRQGAKLVTGSMLTRRNACVFRLSTVGGRSIIGTGDHPVWVDGAGFIPLERIQEGMSVCVMPALSGVVRSGTPMDDTMSEQLGCIALSGRQPMAQSQRVITSTTSMETRLIIGLKTSSCSVTANTAPFMQTTILRRCATLQSGMPTQNCERIVKSDLQKGLYRALSVALSSGAPRSIQRAFVRRAVSNEQGLGRSTPSSVDVNTAEIPMWPSSGFRSIALGDATTLRPSSGRRLSCFERSSVQIAERYLNQSASMQDSVSTRVPSLSTEKIASVEKLAQQINVYDIAVDDAHEFFANGILVHNCDEAAAWARPDTWDMLMMGLRLGEHPRVVVTTTPKMVPLMRSIQSMPGLVVTRGRTLDNAANLAPSFLTGLMARYEGTRLGRQELEGEDLDDNPDALWQREGIDAARVRHAPELRRVVVAIDPAVTSNADSDETGIVVAGLGTDGRGYVLADRSGRYKPDGWARRAVEAYHEWKADRIVAEGNQGGEMVTHVIGTVEQGLPIRIVHATRGKVTRAEPVAALYEQGRVSHVGSLAQLEDQLCTWTPGAGSPDRLDALVWALTELMLGRGELAFA